MTQKWKKLWILGGILAVMILGVIIGVCYWNSSVDSIEEAMGISFDQCERIEIRNLTTGRTAEITGEELDRVLQALKDCRITENTEKISPDGGQAALTLYDARGEMLGDLDFLGKRVGVTSHDSQYRKYFLEDLSILNILDSLMEDLGIHRSTEPPLEE